MKVMITKSGNKKSWYSNEIGNTYAVLDNPPEWTKEDLLSDVYYVDHPKNTDDTAAYVRCDDCVEVWDVLPKAIEPNEHPNEVAAEEEVYGNDCKDGQCS